MWKESDDSLRTPPARSRPCSWRLMSGLPWRPTKRQRAPGLLQGLQCGRGVRGADSRTGTNCTGDERRLKSRRALAANSSNSRNGALAQASGAGRSPVSVNGRFLATHFTMQTAQWTVNGASAALQVSGKSQLEPTGQPGRCLTTSGSAVLTQTTVPAEVVRLDQSCGRVSDICSSYAEQTVHVLFLSSCRCRSSSGIICAGPSRFGLTLTARRKNSSALRMLPN